jgi:hypothetical protein
MNASTVNAVPRKSSRKKKSVPASKRDSSREKLAERCGKLLGSRVTSMEFPGGKSRRSFRLLLEDRESVIASIRPTRHRAWTECKVLSELASRGALVPQLIADDGRRLLIQEEIPGIRLSQALHSRDESGVEQVLDAALTSLAQAHSAGSEAGLDTRLTSLGQSFKWMVGLLDRPAVIGNYLKIPAPRPRLKELETLLAIRKPRFVKWDSRPGNAMVRDDGKVYWFDWEHCGTRNRLDDVAWLLADEYVPDCPEVEERLIEKHIGNFADDLSIDEAKQYLSAYGVFHLCVRLGLICKYKVRGDWWNHEYCLAGDKVGVSWTSMLRVCRRGQRWASRNPYTAPLAGWFMAIADQFEASTMEESVHVR